MWVNDDVPGMSDAVARVELARAVTRMSELAAGHDADGLTPEEHSEFDALELRHREISRRILELAGDRVMDDVRSSMRAGAGVPAGVRVEGGAAFRHEMAPSARGQVGEARSVVDGLARRGVIADATGEVVAAMLEVGAEPARRRAAEWVTVAGSNDYLSAFARLVVDPVRGHLMWTPQESDAFRRAETYRESERAAALSPDTAGGFLAPLALDPTVLLTNAGTTSALRPLAKVVTITSDTYAVHTSAGVSAEWRAEAAEVADQTPTLAQPQIPVHTGDAFVQFSFEVGMDAVGLVNELRTMLVDAYDRHTATAFAIGTGVGQPQGLITGLQGTAADIAGAGEAITRGHVYTLQNALPARWQPRAQWLGSMSVFNALSQLTGTTADDRLAEEVLAGRLARRPYTEITELPANPDPTVNATNRGVLIYGEIAAGYTIVQRAGTTMELIPHMMGANRRPTLQRGLLLWHRTGAGVVNQAAFKMLTITTAAP